ncbi:MAG: hypothetical protein AAGF73_19310 [Actinomycetota bacterium]
MTDLATDPLLSVSSDAVPDDTCPTCGYADSGQTGAVEAGNHGQRLAAAGVYEMVRRSI